VVYDSGVVHTENQPNMVKFLEILPRIAQNKRTTSRIFHQNELFPLVQKKRELKYTSKHIW